MHMRYRLTIKVRLKSDKRFKAHFEAENAVPVLSSVGEEAFQNVKSGPELIKLINKESGIESYSYDVDDIWEEEGRKKLEKIRDFAMAEEIVLKEELETDDENYVHRETIVLNEENNISFQRKYIPYPQSTRVNFPRSVKSVGRHAFDDCPYLALVLDPDSESIDDLSKTSVAFYVLDQQAGAGEGKSKRFIPMGKKRIIG